MSSPTTTTLLVRPGLAQEELLAGVVGPSPHLQVLHITSHPETGEGGRVEGIRTGTGRSAKGGGPQTTVCGGSRQA